MCVYFCVTMSCRCDPQEATNCEEEAEKGPKTGVRSSAKLLQLRRTSVEKKNHHLQEISLHVEDVGIGQTN